MRVKTPALGELLLSQSEGIRALCRLQHLSYFGKDDEIPLGCVVNTVDESCEVFLLAKVRARAPPLPPCCGQTDERVLTSVS